MRLQRKLSRMRTSRPQYEGSSRFFVVSLLWALALLQGGCAGNYAPVVDYYPQARQSESHQSRDSSVHRVRRGDTLYSIAWRYGKDYRALAAANNIVTPYTIYPGENIRLSGDGPPARRAVTQASATVSRTLIAAKPATPTPVVKKPTEADTKPPPKPITPPPKTGWRWPAEGELVGKFSSSGEQRGIRIAAQEGTPIHAADAGIVVYRGDGLPGYGNLLIIKHDEQWLSAYAHNSRMLVREGDRVNSGQPIAAMGSTGTSRSQLHFEIRKKGQPVDPLALLPAP